MEAAILPSQPENYWRLLRRSWRLYRISFRKVIFLSCLLTITAFIPRLLSYMIGEDFLVNIELFSPHQLWLFIINIASYIFFIGIIWHMHCVIIQKKEPLSEDFAIGLKKVFSVFIAAVLQGLILLALGAVIIGSQILIHQYSEWFFSNPIGVFILCAIFLGEFFLLLYVAALFIFIVPLIAIENLHIITALERSALLVWNHWWRVISLQMTPWICFLFVLSFCKFILNINVHIFLIDHTTHSFAVTILQIVLFAIFIPWVAATFLIQLKDLELRKHIRAG